MVAGGGSRAIGDDDLDASVIDAFINESLAQRQAAARFNIGRFAGTTPT